MKFEALLVLVSIASTQGFFNFFKGSSPSSSAAEVIDPKDLVTTVVNATRGVSPASQAKYLEPTFICDGTKVLSNSQLNDGYCDCTDGTDEPGTSACNNGVFVCVNKGFRMVRIPTSRVDDRVCDCCDGSDEGTVHKCPNTCTKAAEKERGEIDRLTKAFREGSTVRTGLLSTVKEDKQKVARMLGPVNSHLEKIQVSLSDVESRIKTIESELRATHNKEVAAKQSDIHSLLGVHQLSVEQLSQLVSNLLTLLNLEEHHVKRAITTASLTPDETPKVSGVTHDSYEDAATTEEGDPASHPEDYDHDGYADDLHHSHENPDTHTAADAEAEGQASISAEASVPCDMGKFANDPRLASLCKSENVFQELANVLLYTLKEHKSVSEVTLLLGYYQLHKSFVGSDAYIKSYLDEHKAAAAASGTEASAPCPAEFANCHIQEQLQKLVAEANKLFSTDSHAGLGELRENLMNMQKKKREYESEKRRAEEAQTDLEQFGDYLEFLALKGKCFDTVDGKYTYSACMLDRVKQQETGSSGSGVSLGEYDSIERSADHMTVTMKFKNGQYCYNHGPREADVVISCGSDNLLKSAREPSTCHYVLELESPAACTPQYAEAVGISEL